MTAPLSPLEARIADVLAVHRVNYHQRNVGGETSSTLRYTSCDGCDWLGGWHDEKGWEAHVAAEVAKALGAETRVEWATRFDAPTTDAEAPLREGHIYDRPGDKWSALRVAELDPRWTAVSRTVTVVPPLVGDWQEAES